MNGGDRGRRFFRTPTKDRDEDLHLFREMHKRDKGQIISLLQPVSEEFEPNSGNSHFYRIASAKKGFGFEFLTENDKNDYDWLKTPPATPLFPSLEMEANAPELVVQREIPIFQPLTRFSGQSEALKTNYSSKSPTPKYKVPFRSITPGAIRPNFSSTADSMNTKGTVPSRSVTPGARRPNFSSNTDSMNTKGTLLSNFKSSNQQGENPPDFINPSKTPVKDSTSKPQSRGVSPLVRSRMPSTIPGFSDETPTNLRTDRSSSASRARPSNATITIHPKPEGVNPRRQSCSPSTSRGRRIELKQEIGGDSTMGKGQIQGGGNGTLVFGSKMVEKVMNARKSVVVGGEEREIKLRVGVMAYENSGFGRMMAKNSLDVALKHMERRRDPINLRHGNQIKSPSITSNTSKSNSNSNSESSPRSNQALVQGARTRNQESSWKSRKETRKYPIRAGDTRSNWGLC